jgi:uncharacterized protein (TIGR00297 family)
VVDPQVLSAVIGVVVCAGFAFLAFGLQVLDLWGSLLAFVLAFVIVMSPGLAALEGLRWLGLLIFFVFVGFIITKMFWRLKVERGVAEGKKGVRGWRNVASNGLVPAIMALLTGFVEPELVAIGFATAVATAASDTFASELGVLSTRTYLVTNPWRKVPPGTNGGVSNWGHLMALSGAGLATLGAVVIIGLPWSQVWIPILAGWLGCQLDSVLGALFEEERGRIYGFMNKSDVNFLSIAVASFTVLLIVAA